MVCEVYKTEPSKRGKYLLSSRIPIMAPDAIRLTRPNFVLMLPSNIFLKVNGQLSLVREWSTGAVAAVPALTIE